MTGAWNLDRLDRYLTSKMAEFGVSSLRVSLGIVFFWFGFLKFFPGISSAEEIAVETTRVISFGLVPDHIALWSVATLETVIGLGLIWGVQLRAVLLLLWMQMIGTLSPLLLFPSKTFAIVPWVPTLEGQYIIKNLVLISAAIVVGATVRGGKLIADPARIRRRHGQAIEST